MMNEKKKMPLLIKIFIASILTISGIILAVYLGVGYYFQTHFYPFTSINGISMSLANEQAVEEAFCREIQNYLLSIHDREDRVTYIDSQAIDYTYVADEQIATLLKQQSGWQWPILFREKYEYTLAIQTTYDEAKLIACIEAMPCFDPENIVLPENAYIGKTDDGYGLVPEKKGSQPIKEQIIADIQAAVQSREKLIYLDDDDYVQPDITSEDPKLMQKIGVLEKYKQMTITYEIEGYEQILDGDTIISWIDIKDDLSIQVDEKMTADYAQQLASTYNTFADVRKFQTTKHGTIEIGGGDYGWIIAKSKESQQLIEDIMKGESVTREPCYEQRAFVGGKNDIGNTYIEIDYSNQHLWYYENGKVAIESDLVSGTLNNGNGSPDGVFKVIDRRSPAVLKGEDYESDVTYFMPFAYNVGLHDADWRNQFGGSIYKNNGSHGCINLPFETAEYLYKNVKLGTPVIAYYTNNVSLTSNNARVSNAYSYKKK